jgi:hypothetical protein
MKEIYELRVFEKQFPRVFNTNEGKKLNERTFIVKIDSKDPRVNNIRAIEEQANIDEKNFFYSSYRVIRKYSKSEIDNARIFTLIQKSIFEPSSEDCGTEYDSGSECLKCGAGGRQVSKLYICKERIPKNKDIVQTIANEILVSQRFIEIYNKNCLTGARFQPVFANRNKNASLVQWHQMIIDSASAEIIAPTKAGISAFVDDKKGEYRCPDGHLLGLNRTTEVTLSRTTRGDEDILYSKQYFGQRKGVLRPHREILVSPRLRSLIVKHRLKGVEFEVAHLL